MQAMTRQVFQQEMASTICQAHTRCLHFQYGQKSQENTMKEGLGISLISSGLT
jgi:hypothetical protein